MEDEPIGLPKGSVRAIIVLVLIFLAAAMMIKGMKVDEWFIALLSASVMFYFGTREKCTVE